MQGLIALQALFLGAYHAPARSQELGAWILASCLVRFACLVPQILVAANRLSDLNEPTFILRVTDCGLLVILGLFSVLMPRRPSVYVDGKEVYPEFTVSIFNRFTWTWARVLLDRATKLGDLDEKDIPEVDHALSSAKLVRKWNTHSISSRFLYSLLWAYKGQVFFQWSLTLFRCFLGLGPYYIMLKLLQSLEAQAAGAPPTPGLWAYVIYLGLLTLAEQVRTRSQPPPPLFTNCQTYPAPPKLTARAKVD